MKAPSDSLPFPENLIEQAHRDVDAERKAKNLPPIDWEKQGQKLMERRNQNRDRHSRAMRKALSAAVGRILG